MTLASSYLRMMRIEDWIIGYFFIPLIGTIAVAGISPLLWITAIVSACILAFGFVINNLADVEIDRKHTAKCEANKNPLVNQSVTIAGTRCLLVLLAVIPLVLSLFYSVPAFFCIAITLIVWAAYSVSPFRLKECYLLDLATHAIMAGPMLFLIGYTLADPNVPLLTPAAISLCILFTCIGCIALLVHQIGDYDQDRGHSTTTVVQIGKKKGWVLLAALFLISLASLFGVHSVIALEPWVLLGSIALFTIPVFTLRHEIRRDFFPSSSCCEE
ncbi:MAG: UbiA family prenyltransferase [Methanoregula sp.]|nr:UbiA family prenyltransferase [Methanoregula sp.]